MPFTVTLLPTCSTAAITAVAPTRPSLRIPNPLASASTQRILPSRTSWASHAVVTWLSRPEKPPMPTTSRSPSTSAEAAVDWLDTASVPPPWLRM